MSEPTPPPATPTWMKVLGWILTVLPMPLLAMSAFFKIAQPEGFIENWTKGGYPANTALPIGLVELGCAILYLFPNTAVLGAILLTGYLGGAVATHVRAGDPSWQVAIPVVIGVIVWLGIYFRDARLRAIAPFRN